MFLLNLFLKHRSSHRRCSIKKAILKNFAIFTEKKTRVLESSTQVPSCEICEIFKNTYLEEHLQTDACETLVKTFRNVHPGVFPSVPKR